MPGESGVKIGTMVSTGLLCALTLSLAYSLRQSHRQSAQVTAALLSTQRALQESARNEKGYRDVIFRQKVDPPALYGVSVTNGDSEAFVAGDSATVVYLLESACQACALNYGFLQKLAEHRPGAVVALSLRDDPGTLSKYAQEHELSFPVLARPAGSLIDLTPKHGTPITMLLQKQHVVAIMPGRLTDDQMNATARLIDADRPPALQGVSTH